MALAASPLPIVFFTDSPLLGGAEIVLGHLLAALDPAIQATVTGNDPEVVAFLAARRPSARAEVLPIVDGRRDLGGFVRLMRLLRGFGPRIFQANVQGGAAAQYPLLAATLLPGVRTVAFEHLPVDCDTELQRRLKAFTNRRLAGHVAPGRGASREIETLSGLPAGSVIPIYACVPEVELEPRPRASDGFIVGTLGRLHRQKGYDVLIRAMADVADTTLVIVGDGPERDALEALAIDVGVRDQVRFEGWQDGARHFLTAFDAFVLPSRFEGFPLSIVEAMQAGLPVVSTPVGSIAEAVSEGETGLLVAPEDPVALAAALRSLRDDPALRARMGESARERAQAFTPAAMARDFQALYGRVA